MLRQQEPKLNKPQPEHVGVEVDISLRVASDTGGVVDARLGRRHRCSDALPFHAGRASDHAPCRPIQDGPLGYLKLGL